MPALSRAAAHAIDLFTSDLLVDSEANGADAAGASKWGVGRWGHTRARLEPTSREMQKTKGGSKGHNSGHIDCDEGADGNAEQVISRQLQQVYLDPSNFVGSGGTMNAGGSMSRSTYARWRGQAIDVETRVRA